MSQITTNHQHQQQLQQPQLINNRDRLLRLAEFSCKQQPQQPKKKLRIPSLSLDRSNSGNSSATRSNNNSKLLDLSFTDNIEHLVNNSPDNNSKLNKNSKKSKKEAKKKNGNDSSNKNQESNRINSKPPISVLDQLIINDDHDHDQKYSRNESSTIVSRIPLHHNGYVKDDPFFSQITGNNHNNNDNTSNNHNDHSLYSDLYQKYYEFREKNMKNNRPTLLRMQSDLQSSSLLRSLKNFNNVKSYSHNQNHSNNQSNNVQNVKYIPIQRSNNNNDNDYDIPSIVSIVSSTSIQPQSIVESRSKSTINHHHAYTDKFVLKTDEKFAVLDEDDHNQPCNTPKKINTNQPEQQPVKDESNVEVLFPRVDLFNCDQYPPSVSAAAAPTLSATSSNLNNSNESNDLIGQLCLASSQRNVINSIIAANKNCDNSSHQQQQSKQSMSSSIIAKLNKHPSDPSIHPSENDLINWTKIITTKNDLNGLSHLEETSLSNDYDGMINKFVKKFSLRSSSSSTSSRCSNNDNSSKSKRYTRSALGGKSNSKKRIDYNQNYDYDDGYELNVDDDDDEKSNGKLSPLQQSLKPNDRNNSPLIIRNKQFISTINRKSLKNNAKILRKQQQQHRLRRSQTQPLIDDDVDGSDDDDDHVAKDDNGSDIKLISTNLSSNNNGNEHGDDGNNNNQTMTANIHNITPSPTNNNIIYAEAIFDYQSNDNEELSFKAGDLMKVSDISHKQWWWGTILKNPNNHNKQQQQQTTNTATETSNNDSMIMNKTTNNLITFDEIRHGWIPASYVRLKVNQQEEINEIDDIDDNRQQSLNDDQNIQDSSADDNCNAAKMSPTTSSPSIMSTSMMNKMKNYEQIRSNVMLEIWNTEKDFVKNLKDVIDGYLKPCRDRKDMFDEERIQKIFGNIEELYRFQHEFLQQLEQCIDLNDLSASCIGDCFLRNESGFDCYSDFCKNHPLAMNELQELYKDHKYVIFFEGCRLLQNMIDISLDGFLLTPIQKICKYPLQLGELLKYTPKDHPDYESINNAHKCMQRVAQLVNERKSRFESLEKLLSLQEMFDDWNGPLLLDTSSILIHSGEVARISRVGIGASDASTATAAPSSTSSMTTWSKDITLFLFDHLLIVARKTNHNVHNLLLSSSKKRHHSYSFKTRINMDHIDEIISLNDNQKDQHFNVTGKNAFKFYYHLKQKWYLFQTKTPEDKSAWLKAFDDERKRCSDDERQGFRVTEQDKRNAQLAYYQNNMLNKVNNSKKPKQLSSSIRSKPSSSSHHHRNHHFQHHTLKSISTNNGRRKPDTIVDEVPLEPLLNDNLNDLRNNNSNDKPINRYNRAGSLPSYIHHHTLNQYNNGQLNKNRQSNMIQSNNNNNNNRKLLKSNWFHRGTSNNHNNNVQIE